MLRDFEQIVIGNMISENIIPSMDIFQITEFHLQTYISLYGKLFGKQNGGIKSKTNSRYARKLAGLTLLKLNFSRDAKFNDMKSGLVYIIENEVYPEHYKMGMTIELNSRLSSYQTYDPLQRFKIVKYDFVLDRVLTEKKLLNHPEVFRETGEWVKKGKALEIFEKICFNNF